MRPYDIILPLDGTIQQIVDTPQQDGGMDCGVVVLLLMKKFFQQISITQKECEKELPHMRTEIVRTILNWGNGREYVADQLRKKRRTAR